MQEISLFSVKGAAVAQYLPDVARLRIRVFRDFPYLYDGSEEYEANYLQTYASCPQSIWVMAKADDQLIGVSTAIPMRWETEAFKRPFKARGIETDSVFYLGESVLINKYRGRGIYKQFFQQREAWAKQLGGFDWLCFCAVRRPDNHPLKPEHYEPLDPVWNHFGYQKKDEFSTAYNWKDIDQDRETDKTMVFWFKPFNGEVR